MIATLTPFLGWRKILKNILHLLHIFAAPSAHHYSFTRLIDSKFREQGLMLPFGYQTKDFIGPNPFFYDNKGKWDVGYDAAYLPALGIDPWALQEVAKKYHVPKNDINGAIFFLRREQIRTFCRRIQKLKVEFTLSYCNVALLGNFIAMTSPYPSFRFDRIDISNVADVCHLGLGYTVRGISALLKHPNENKFATLVGCFLSALLLQCPTEATKETKDLVTKLLPKPIFGNPEIAYKIDLSGIEEQRYTKALEMFEDVERLWRRYQFRKNFQYVQCYGLVEKEEHTIIPKWPYRINTQQDFASVKACFELRRGGMWGGERFVEWKRTTGPTFFELNPKILGIESVMKEPLLLFGDGVAKHKKGCKVCCCDCAEGKKKGAPSNCDNPRERGIEEATGVIELHSSKSWRGSI